MLKYGVDNPFKSKEVQDIIKTILLEKYGVDNIFKNEEIIKIIKIKSEKTRIEKGLQTSTNDKTKYQKYRNKISNLTNKNKIKLFEKWDGLDFYDKSYIKENLHLHYNDDKYPTIDHKISVLYGFLNKISAKKISALENLCITKRSINSKKGAKCHQEFIETMYK